MSISTLKMHGIKFTNQKKFLNLNSYQNSREKLFHIAKFKIAIVDQILIIEC